MPIEKSSTKYQDHRDMQRAILLAGTSGRELKVKNGQLVEVGWLQRMAYKIQALGRSQEWKSNHFMQRQQEVFQTFDRVRREALKIDSLRAVPRSIDSRRVSMVNGAPVNNSLKMTVTMISGLIMDAMAFPGGKYSNLVVKGLDDLCQATSEGQMPHELRMLLKNSTSYGPETSNNDSLKTARHEIMNITRAMQSRITSLRNSNAPEELMHSYRTALSAINHELGRLDTDVLLTLNLEKELTASVAPEQGLLSSLINSVSQATDEDSRNEALIKFDRYGTELIVMRDHLQNQSTHGNGDDSRIEKLHEAIEKFAALKAELMKQYLSSPAMEQTINDISGRGLVLLNFPKDVASSQSFFQELNIGGMNAVDLEWSFMLGKQLSQSSASSTEIGQTIEKAQRFMTAGWLAAEVYLPNSEQNTLQPF